MLDCLIDKKILKILRLFLKNPDSYFHIKKISEETKVPLATTFRIVNRLLEHNIIQYNQISKFKIYSLKKNKEAKKLAELIK